MYVFSRKPDCGNARIKPTYVLSITLPLGRCASLFAMSSHSQATQSCRYRVTHCRRDLREISHLDKFLQNKFAVVAMAVKYIYEACPGRSCVSPVYSLRRTWICVALDTNDRAIPRRNVDGVDARGSDVVSPIKFRSR